MVQRIKFSCGLLARHCGVTALTAAVFPALLLVGASAWGATPELSGPVTLQFTIPVPVASTNATGGMYGFDISWVELRRRKPIISATARTRRSMS